MVKLLGKVILIRIVSIFLLSLLFAYICKEVRSDDTVVGKDVASNYKADDLHLYRDSTYIKYGVGLDTGDGTHSSTDKFFAGGHQAPIGTSIFDWEGELGLWADSNLAQGRKSSLFADVGPGLSIVEKYWYAKDFAGPAIISTTDSRLGSYIEFTNSIEGGLRASENGTTIGLGWQHFSDAGLTKINEGRNFVYIKLGIQF